MNVRKQSFLSIVVVCTAIISGALFLSMHTSAGAQDSSVSLTPSNSSVTVTTTESFEGYRIKEYKGIVRGITVRAPGPVSNLKAGLKSIVGGKISPFIRMCETARQQALDAMVERAQAVGANAVVGFRYDSSAYGDADDMGTEVVCYGTAVVIVPKDALKSANLQ